LRGVFQNDNKETDEAPEGKNRPNDCKSCLKFRGEKNMAVDWGIRAQGKVKTPQGKKGGR